jgi:hypothetical protein
MPTALFDIQLTDATTGQTMIDAGGTVYVAPAGEENKQALVNADTGATLANPLTPTRGKIRFGIASVSPLETAVDLYGMTANGRAFVVKNVKSGNASEIFIDTVRRDQTLIIPFSIANTTAATETDTGFDLPAQAQVRPFPSIFVVDVDATEVIDVGLLSSESGGDADGFIDGVSLATAGHVDPTFASAVTQGALLRVTATGASAVIPESHIINATARSVTYTLDAGTDTATGFIQIPYVLAPNA